MKDLSLHVMDIAGNSIAAGATVIVISLACHHQMLTFRLSDNGRGMDQELLQKVTDPFTTTRTTRKVGMGIPLLKLSAEMAGGRLSIESKKGTGTTVVAEFITEHIDRIPVGEMDETMKALILANPALNFVIKFTSDLGEFELNTMDIKKTLNGLPIQTPQVIQWIGESIREGLKEVFGGVLNEVSG